MTRSWESIYIGLVGISPKASDLAKDDIQGQKQHEHIVLTVATMHNNNKWIILEYLIIVLMITTIIIKKDVTIVMEWFFVQIFGNLDVLLLLFFYIWREQFLFDCIWGKLIRSHLCYY